MFSRVKVLFIKVSSVSRSRCQTKINRLNTASRTIISLLEYRQLLTSVGTYSSPLRKSPAQCTATTCRSLDILGLGKLCH